jgi:hypothetical protein
LNLFSRFADLVNASQRFCTQYCPTTVAVPVLPAGSIKFSVFDREAFKLPGKYLDNETMLTVMNRENGRAKEALFENHSAFNRGAHRSVIAMMMIHDLRMGYWHPDNFTPDVCANLYTLLKRARSWQAPKVIQLYAQQCFGAHSVLPIDTWIEAFLKWPLGFDIKKHWHKELFNCSDVWGKIERLIWLAAQARKVHSSVAEAPPRRPSHSRSHHSDRGSGAAATRRCRPPRFCDHHRQLCRGIRFVQPPGCGRSPSGALTSRRSLRTDLPQLWQDPGTRSE